MTDKWQSILDQQGAIRDEQGVRGFADQTAQNAEADKLFALDQSGCLLLDGPDAKKFLQGQVTCDVNALSPGQSLTGGHCNTKGRLTFSFRAVLLSSDDSAGAKIALIMHRGLLATAQQTLAKFIVFSKATLSIDESYHILGLAGSTARQLLNDAFPNETAPNETRNAAIQHNDGAAIRVAADRFLCVLKEDSAIQQWQQWSERCQLHGHEEWNLADIRDGLGQIVPGNEEMFIPQMLNMQLLDGVSFTKGCYVGQEVVARMQYLGKLKRHMRRLQLKSSTLPLPGAPLYSAGSSQSVGNVVLAAPAGKDVELLAVTTDEAFANDSLHLDQDNQQKLYPLDLPYTID